MEDFFKCEQYSFDRLSANDLSNSEIDNIGETDMSIACGSILLSKNDMNVYFSCFTCEMELHDFEEFLEHTLLYHFGLKETDLAVILSKMSKKKEKPASTSKADVSDINSIKVDLEDAVSEETYKEPDLNVVNNVEAKNFIGKFENFVNHIESDRIAEVPSNEHLDSCGSISDADADLIEYSVDTTDQKTADFEFVIIDPDKFGSEGNANKIKDSSKTIQTCTNKFGGKKRIFNCTVCDKSFNVRHNYVLHMRRHHNVKPYVCEFCDARFPDSSNWKVHRQRHLGIKPHKCTMCEKSFTSTGDLKKHVLIHTGERRFLCIDCGKSYRTATLLNYHLRRHSDDRPYECVTCGKRFYEMHLLRDHEVSHSSERPFECPKCKMKFSRNKALREHSKLHSDVRQYACKLCPKKFAQCAGLHSHMKTHLSGDKTTKKERKDI